MTARGWGYVVLVVLVLALAGTGYLFIVQNQLRTTQLSLDLGFAAWQLSAPIPVVWLALGSFGGGLVVATVVIGSRLASTSRKLRRLEADLALSGWNNDASRPGSGTPGAAGSSTGAAASAGEREWR